jgi:hypothetical protein
VIDAGRLPPRSVTKLVPEVIRLAWRQHELVQRRALRRSEDRTPPATLHDRLFDRYRRYRSEQQGPPQHAERDFYRRLRNWLTRTCEVCEVRRDGVRQWDEDSSYYRAGADNADEVGRPVTRLVRHPDGGWFCGQCYDRALETLGSGPPRTVPILLALWSLNRFAKRFRDASRVGFNEGNHEWARWYSSLKASIYPLKEQCLHYLLANGELEVNGHHRFKGGISDGNWAEVLAGDGYQFHRPCPPPSPPPDDLVELEGIEAKPVDATEATYRDALFTVIEWFRGRERVKVYQWQSREEQRLQTSLQNDSHYARPSKALG